MSSGSELFSHPDVPLLIHLQRTAQRAVDAVGLLPLPSGWLEKDRLREIVSIIALGHDLGKATGYFQRYLGGEPHLKGNPRSRHAEFSALVVGNWVQRVAREWPLEPLSCDLTAALAYTAVRCHHTGLSNVYDDLAPLDWRQQRVLADQADSLASDSMSALLRAIRYPGSLADMIATVREPDKWLRQAERAVRAHLLRASDDTCLDVALLLLLLFSLLVDADRKEAGGAPALARSTISASLVDRFRRRSGWDRKAGGIGEIRNRLFREVTGRAAGQLDGGLLTLTAPTGTGKTVAVLSFALRLRERLAAQRGQPPRIIYALPFLSIVDQTHQVFEQVLDHPDSSQLIAHHHLSDSAYRLGDDEFDSDVGELLIEGWDSEIVVTTFVQLFHTLISHRSRPLRRFWRTAGAIIILDEVQCLPHRYWLLFRRMAEAMNQRFGTTFVLMTATQPAIFSPDQTIELAGNSEEIFGTLDRIDFELDVVDGIYLPDLAEMVHRDLVDRPNSDVLVTLNTIRAARSLFKQLRDIAPDAGDYYFLSSHVVPKHRLVRLAQAKRTERRKIVVSTQVVEAGVDLDCDLVYRDFGPLDSLIQVAGRCNRHASKATRGRTRVVRLLDETAGGDREFGRYIYDAFLLDCTRRAFGQEKCCLGERDFREVVKRYYGYVSGGLSDADSQRILKAMADLRFDGSEDSVSAFQLIDENRKVDVFVEVDEEARRVWQQYLELRQIRDLGERRRGFASIKSLFSHHLISVYPNVFERNPLPTIGRLGYLPTDLVAQYYDSETGIRLEAETSQLW